MEETLLLTVHVVRGAPPDIPKELKVEVSASDTIQERTGIPGGRQRLVLVAHAGALEGPKTLREVGISPDSAVCLSVLPLTSQEVEDEGPVEGEGDTSALHPHQVPYSDLRGKTDYGPLGEYACDGCGEHGKGNSYHCAECCFDLCRRCFSSSRGPPQTS